MWVGPAGRWSCRCSSSVEARGGSLGPWRPRGRVFDTGAVHPYHPACPARSGAARTKRSPVRTRRCAATVMAPRGTSPVASVGSHNQASVQGRFVRSPGAVGLRAVVVTRGEPPTMSHSSIRTVRASGRRSARPAPGGSLSRGGRTRRRASAALTAAVTLGTGLGAAPALASATPALASVAPARSVSAGASTAPSAISPRVAVHGATAVHGAAAAAAWLARQVQPSGAVHGVVDSDFAATELAVLALAAPGTQRPTALRALGYVEHHVAAGINPVPGRGNGNPGLIGFAILDARALGANPRHFGGLDLVARLEATMRSSGADSGLFGTADPTFDGAYRQGVALAALAAAGVVDTSRVRPAIAWLTRQQCGTGGWTAYRPTLGAPCRGMTAPDTNSTALAVEGLAAQHGVPHYGAIGWIRRLENGDGGWGYNAGSSSDPDSTALVRQALLSRHLAHEAWLTKRHGTPLSALEHFQLTTGASAGALVFPPAPGANLYATEQAEPALAGEAVPLVSRS